MNSLVIRRYNIYTVPQYMQIPHFIIHTFGLSLLCIYISLTHLTLGHRLTDTITENVIVCNARMWMYFLTIFIPKDCFFMSHHLVRVFTLFFCNVSCLAAFIRAPQINVQITECEKICSPSKKHRIVTFQSYIYTKKGCLRAFAQKMKGHPCPTFLYNRNIHSISPYSFMSIT